MTNLRACVRRAVTDSWLGNVALALGILGWGLQVLAVLWVGVWIGGNLVWGGRKEPKGPSPAPGVERALSELVLAEGAWRKHFGELVGVPSSRFDGVKYCYDLWVDTDDVLVRGWGPKNGSPAVGWLTVTGKGETTVGRYAFDVWSGTEPSTGAIGFPSSYSVIQDFRLVERHPPAAAAPPGWTAIRPGQCVLGNLAMDTSRVVGRYLVELPAHRTVFVHWEPMASEIRLDPRLSLAGSIVPRANDRTYEFRIEEAGRYQITVHRLDEPFPSDETKHTDYTLQVDWGQSSGTSCAPPRPGQSSCF
jgi:hypothetical protein